jgi:hypothetical protein
MHRKTYERAKLKCEELEEPLRTNRHSVIGSRILAASGGAAGALWLASKRLRC